MTSRGSATLVGLSAIAMWSLLGLMAAAAGAVPPFLMNALAFGISGVGATLALALTGRLSALRQPLKVWIFGTAGLFGFHFFYFTSLQHAPKVEANLVNYAWPLLIVLFSGLLPGERLRWHHVAGAGLGLAGAALIVTGGRGLAVDPAHAWGYGAAVASALIWSSYSVLSRRLGAVPTAAVAGFCLATAVLSGLCHLALEETRWPDGPTAWTALVGLGLFPVGLAFFAWDVGVKRGNIQVLGAASYLSPLFSTVFLILAGFGRFTPAIVVAAAMITGGALLASKDVLLKPRAAPEPA
ncbi:aromatic amino acid exporter YddG [Prosthecomicrobium sp. N25]|uniref:aromatic amino acid exporter YddG n=1 Tax=Prosthecomicrobium sp. N25 TaxID=3129254 RepID=UPI003076E52D